MPLEILITSPKKTAIDIVGITFLSEYKVILISAIINYFLGIVGVIVGKKM